jgi:fructose-1,6-bisphosphatase
MHDRRKTLTRYTIEQEHRHPNATGVFSGLLNAVATAVKIISNQVGKGVLINAAPTLKQTLGRSEPNGPGTMDMLSNDAIVHEAEWGGHLAAMASDELEGMYAIPPRLGRGKYLLLADPLEGTKNLDVNLAVGTIFSILRTPNPGVEPKAEDFLQPGTQQVCAGFALYGPATVLVLTTGTGVDGFTLDRDIGAFVLTHPQMRVPEDTSEVSVNASNCRFWEPPITRYMDECVAGASGPRGKDFNMRWIASSVKETFRILTRGGVFLHPKDRPSGKRERGRMRLLYEANPLSFIIEQAGGAATTGRERVLDIVPSDLRERVPLIFGSKKEVERIIRYHEEHARGTDKAYDSPLFGTRSLFRTP